MIIIAVLGETQLHVVRAKKKKIHSALNKRKKQASDYCLVKPQGTQSLWESFEFEFVQENT